VYFNNRRLVYLGCLSVLFDNVSRSVRILDPGAKLDPWSHNFEKSFIDIVSDFDIKEILLD